jgi:plasmid stability protein
MTDVSVTLPEELLAALRAEARRRHTSVSAVAREALGDHFGWGQHGPHTPEESDVRHAQGENDQPWTHPS